MAFEMRHNGSKVVMPDGHDRNSLKRLTRLCKSLAERERALLAWVLDQASTWTMTVGQIRKEMQWGEKRWARVRNSLAAKGVLTQTKERLGKNSHSHHLHFDFVVVAAMELSTEEVKTEGSRARVTPAYRKGSRDPSLWEGVTGDPSLWEGVRTQGLPKSTPNSATAEAGGGPVENEEDEEDGRVQKLLGMGLQAGCARDAARILKTGLGDFEREFSAARARAKNESGLALHVARRAAKGDYDTGQPQPAPLESADSVCARHQHLSGILHGPAGPCALARLGYGGRLADPKSHALLHPADGLKLWLQLAAGELNFEPA